MNWFRTILDGVAMSAAFNGFWPLFWTAYVEMMLISLGDLIFLPCRRVYRSRNRNADSVRKRDWKKHGSKRVWLR